MGKVAIGLGVVCLGLYVAALMIPIDPKERRPGLTLSGSLESAPEDWGDLIEPRRKVWVQTKTWYGIPHSVTTVSFARDGALYIPCARCGGKRWPKNVARDPEVVVKVDDDLYELRAVRVEEPELVQAMLGDAARELDDVWIFRMEPRGAS